MKIIIAFLLFFSSIKAADIEWFMQLGLGAGGATLGEIEFYNAPTEEINAGDGFALGTGIRIRPSQNTNFQNFSTALSIEMIYDSEDASNGDVTYIRFPVTLMEYYTFRNWQLGAGLSYHLNPRVGGDGFASDAKMDLDSKWGKVFEVGYLFSPNISIGLQFSDVEYTFHSQKINTNRVAFVLKLGFPISVQKKSLPTYKEEGVSPTPKRENKSLFTTDSVQKLTVLPEQTRQKNYSKSYLEAREKQFGTTPVKDENSGAWFGTFVEASLEGTSYTTSGDDEDEARIGKEYIPRYVSNNMDTLAIEIASGQGETLETLSSLLEVDDKELFHTRLKEHFATIYHDREVSAIEVYEAIVALK